MPKHLHYNESVCSLIVCENCSTERNPTIKRPNRERDSLCSLCRLGRSTDRIGRAIVFVVLVGWVKIKRLDSSCSSCRLV